MNALTAPNGATHPSTRESLAAPGASPNPGAPAPGPTSRATVGGWANPATLATLEGNLERGAGAASVGSCTANEKAARVNGRPEEESNALQGYPMSGREGATVVPFSEFTERHRLLYESKRIGCDPYALAISEVAALKNLLRAIVWMSGGSLVESHLVEANRLAGAPLPWDRETPGPEVSA